MSSLSFCNMKEKGFMNNDEFTAAMEEIAPLVSEHLLKRLAHECMLTAGSSVVPIKNLACKLYK